MIYQYNLETKIKHLFYYYTGVFSHFFFFKTTKVYPVFFLFLDFQLGRGANRRGGGGQRLGVECRKRVRQGFHITAEECYGQGAKCIIDEKIMKITLISPKGSLRQQNPYGVQLFLLIFYCCLGTYFGTFNFAVVIHLFEKL